MTKDGSSWVTNGSRSLAQNDPFAQSNDNTLKVLLRRLHGTFQIRSRTPTQVDLYCIESRRDWSNHRSQRQSRTGWGDRCELSELPNTNVTPSLCSQVTQNWALRFGYHQASSVREALSQTRVGLSNLSNLTLESSRPGWGDRCASQTSVTKQF